MLAARSVLFVVLLGGLIASPKGWPRSASAQSTNLLDGNPKNGLSHHAFLRNAITNNPVALAALRERPLQQALIDDPRIASQLVEPHARAVMHEIVKCALAPAKRVTYVDPDGVLLVWQGELGLCQHSATMADSPGDWSAAPPTAACQELVTACVMARVNALGQAVPLSLGGLPAQVFPLRAEVQTEKVLRERADPFEDPVTGTPIKSFLAPPCRDGEECEWAPARSGTCATGTTVALAIDSPKCATTPIRVCGGLHGCYGPGSPTGYPSTAVYSKIVREQAGACAAAPITFPCPSAEGIANTFSVMTRPADPRSPPVSPPVIKVSGATARYPATERNLFGHVEGAFYGNLFLAEGLDPICSVPAGMSSLRCAAPATCPAGPCPPAPLVASPNVYACYDLSSTQAAQDDALGVAYLNQRICALPSPDATCFPRPPARCSARCLWDATSGTWRNCLGTRPPDGPASVYRPITTRLNARCDVSGRGPLCNLLMGMTLPD